MVALSHQSHVTAPVNRRQRARRAHAVFAVLLAAAAAFSLAVGASGTSLWGALADLARGAPLPLTEQIVLWEIRAPRTVLGIAVGAALAVSGATMQGLFRNPLADPGIVGVSAGASLGAIAAIVLGASFPVWLQAVAGQALVPIMAFAGAWTAMMALYALSTRGGRTSVATMLLAGIALGALSMSLVGLMVYRANDMQLRELSFWQLGSLAGATWDKVAISGPVIVLAILAANRLASGLNGLTMGEATAHHLGHDVQRLKRGAVLAVAAATGMAVAVSGGIGFIGIVVPHLLRLSTGPDHGPLLINAGLLGGSLLLFADVISRVVVAPAELPIGIVTAVLGAPVFLWILLRQRSLVDL